MSSVGLWKRKSKSVVRESKVGRRDGRLVGERVVGRLVGWRQIVAGAVGLQKLVARSSGSEAGESEYNKVNCNVIEQSDSPVD